MLDTVVVMVSVGSRDHLTDFTFKRLYKWASRNAYNCVLLKQNYPELDKAPHFNKLKVPEMVPGYKRYIIIDDDILMKRNAPAMEEIPPGFVGLCADAVQTNTEAPHVAWTANSGFMVTDNAGAALLAEAYALGEYPFKHNDGSGQGIWGPFDQGIVNDVLFKRERIYKLDSRWNFQPVLDYFMNDKGWNEWSTNRFYRLMYYVTQLIPVKKTNQKKIKEAYGLHLIRVSNPRFFNFLYR